jgi:hypothetical protein
MIDESQSAREEGMEPPWAAAAVRRVAEAPTEPRPFPHFTVTDIFPGPVYERMLASLPRPEEMRDIRRSGNAYAVNRLRLPLNAETLPAIGEERRRIWTEVQRTLCGEAFIAAVVERFRPFVLARYGGVPRLAGRLEILLDTENYQIGPHTDAPHKTFSMLIYLPRDRSQLDLGTSIYVPKMADFRSEKATQFPFDWFRLHRRFDFAPNSAMCFMKTDNSFHGREPVTGPATTRYLMQLAFINRDMVEAGE